MTPQAILDFWFGELDADGFCVEQRNKFWFRADAATDAVIRERFGLLVEQALAGQLDDWASSPRGRLALIVLLDQFSRNLYRGRPGAFAGDARARQLLNEGLALGHDRLLTPIERTFFYLPFEHSEDLDDQQRCVALFRALHDSLPERLRPRVQASLDHAVQHRDIIARFGRFPHRNRAFGRPSGPEERAYLADASTFGQ